MDNILVPIVRCHMGIDKSMTTVLTDVIARFVQVDIDPGMTESGMSPVTEDDSIVCRRWAIFGHQAHGDVGVDLFG